jgi:hypothetical protein
LQTNFLFKTEDPANANGGRWLLTCGNQDNKLDDLWQETLLGMIGDCFSHDTYVNNKKNYIDKL